MKINREFWSGETYDFNAPNENNVLLAQIVNVSMESKILADFDKYIGEWDKSVSPWKINYNSALFSNAWALSWYDGNATEHKFSRFYKERKKGYTFYLATRGFSNNADYDNYPTYTAMYAPQYLSTLTNPDIDLENNTYTTAIHSKYGYIMPVINFNYRRLFVVPVIHYKSNNTDYSAVLQTTTANNFNPSEISGFSFAFYYINSYGTVTEFPIGLFSLNNKIIPPYWSEWTTNCWKNEEIDNGFALLSYRISRGDRYTVTSDFANKLQIEGQEGTAYKDETIATESAAATLNYFPAKREPTFTNALPDREPDIFDDNWTPYYIGGVSGWYMSIYRNCKSTVTFNEFVDYIKLQAAYLGFRFCPFYDKAREGIDSEWFYIPEINDSGVTTGNYYAANSTEAEQLNNYTWTDNVYEVTPYDGTDDEEDTDDNNYDDSNTTVLNPIAGLYANDFQNSYVLDLEGGGGAAGLADVAAYLYYTAPTNSSVHDYLTNNPIDAIISCTMFPFLVDTTIPASGLPFVRFGKVTSDLKALGFISSQIQLIDCGDCTYYPEYGVDDFRSYEPYCDAELILPYCGSVKISPTLIYCKTTNKNFHKISVKYIVDLISGACLACVFLDNLLIDTSNGQIGLTVPVTGVRSADLQRDIFNKQTGLKQAANTGLSSIASTVFGAIGGLSSGDGAAAVKSLANGALSIDSANTSYKAAEYELKHIQVPFTVRAAASPLTDFANEQFPRMIIKRPVMLDYEPEVYAHSVGYACLITGKLSDYGAATGETPQYIECTGLDLSGFSGTETEKARLKAALEGGLYL